MLEVVLLLERLLQDARLLLQLTVQVDVPRIVHANLAQAVTTHVMRVLAGVAQAAVSIAVLVLLVLVALMVNITVAPHTLVVVVRSARCTNSFMDVNKFGHVLKPLMLAILGGWLVQMSWNKWVNVLLDYGRELYTPWRITCGQVLYKEIASLYSPFPPYWNALLFKIFGVSILTLALFNIFIVIVVTGLIYRFFSKSVDSRVAFFASAVFLSLFAFRQTNLDQGDFEFICPYSYSVTYALFFSLWAISLFAACHQKSRDIWQMGIGALIGLTSLCRFEIFVFLAVALVLGFISNGMSGHWPFKRFFKAGALALAGFCIPVGIAFLYFSTQLPLSLVWPSILGTHHHWNGILHNPYYWSMIGMEDPRHNGMIMLAAAGAYCVVFIAFKCLCLGADFLEKKSQRWQAAVLIILGVTLLAQVIVWILSFHENHIFKGLPLVMILMVGLLFKEGKKSLPLLVMAVWGFLMLTKVFLKVQINLEGFVYALPAVLLFVVLFLRFIPGYFERAHQRGQFVAVLSSILLGLIMITGLVSLAQVYQARNIRIQTGPDTIIGDNFTADITGEIGIFLQDVDKIMAKNANFVVYPEGVMLNFLTKRVSPIPYSSFIMVYKIDFGNQELLRSLIEKRPDYMVMENLSRPDNNHLYPNPIRSWIWAHYHPVWETHTRIDGGITVLQRTE